MPEPEPAQMAAYYGCNSEALERLLDRLYPRLVAHLRRLDSDEAEDLALEAAYRLARTKFRPGARYDETKGGFAPWAMRIAWHVWLGHLRRQGRSVDAEPLAEAPWQTPVAAGGDCSEAIAACLEELSPGDRAVLLLSEVEGLRLSELARVLEIGYQAAGTRLHRARRRFRRLLERAGFQVVSRGDSLPAGATVALVFESEMLVRLPVDGAAKSAPREV